MRRASVVLASLVTIGLVAACGSQAQVGGVQTGGAAAIPGIGSWSAAQAVPGTASIGLVDVEAVSCAPHAECTVVGDTEDTNTNSASNGFVISEKNGTWSKPRQIPGLAALAADSTVYATDVSCPASGYCLVTGDYSENTQEGYVAEEEKGTWGKAVPIPWHVGAGPFGPRHGGSRGDRLPVGRNLHGGRGSSPTGVQARWLGVPAC